jgi:hypothetical protein
MTAYDDLLLWASEKRQGTLADLREACSFAAVRADDDRGWRPVHEDLLALGHVDLAGPGWRVTPPRLVRLADAGGLYLLLGARPGWLVKAMDDMDGHHDSGIRDLADHVYENSRIAQRGPSSWYIGLGPQAPLSALSAVGVRVLDDLSGSLLERGASLLADGIRRSVRPGELLSRMVLEGPFVSHGVSWHPTSGDRDEGLYRYMRNNQRVYAFRTRDEWVELDYRSGVWRSLPRTGRYIWYLPRERRLVVAAAVRPPIRVERALFLRTGRVPQDGPEPRATGRPDAILRSYENITLGVATQVAELLRKELELI